jgi:putative SOS response-associated peptidase YedK
MCGRFCCALDPDSIKHKIYEDHISNDKNIKWIDQEEYHSSYNVAPTKNIVVLHTEMGKKEQVLHSMVMRNNTYMSIEYTDICK